MTIMITGGAGFVGLNVAEHLLGRGDAVVLFDMSAPPDRAAAALSGLPGRLVIVRGDVRDGAAVEAAMRAHDVDRLVNGAAITADAAREAREARRIAEVNLIGTIEVLEAAGRVGVKRVVQMSTGAIYGPAADDRLLDEDSDLPTPTSLYAITKFAAERTALRYRETRGLDLAVVRLGTVFGRWEYDTGVRDTISLPLQLHGRATRGESVVLPPGAGADWIYASDIAGGVAALLDAPAIPRGLYHLSSGRFWPAEAWCERLADAFPGFSWRVGATREEADIARNAGTVRAPFSVARIQADLGFSPRFDEAAAFADFFAHHRDIGQAG